MAFTGAPERGSQFKVGFADEPNLAVEVKDANGTWTAVDPSKYTVEYSDKAISSVIGAENRNIPGGTFDVGSETYSLRVQGESRPKRTR